MKILLFFDQIQAGKGGKGYPNTPLQVEPGAIGSSTMFEKDIKDIGGKIVGTMFCGSDYYEKNKDEVKDKICKLVDKLKIDLVICGPAYNYLDYGKMATQIADIINKNTQSKAIVVLSEENEDIINEYKDKVIMVKMPKKGGTGLRESLVNMVKVSQMVYDNKDKSEMGDMIF